LASARLNLSAAGWRDRRGASNFRCPVTRRDANRSFHRISVSGSARFRIGHELAIGFDADRIHFFDKATGIRIAPPVWGSRVAEEARIEA
jgi:hypothetical protein